MDKVFSRGFRQAFFQLGDKKVVTGRVRQLVVLYSNDCTGICSGELVIVVSAKWSSNRGGRWNRFDGNALT